MIGVNYYINFIKGTRLESFHYYHTLNKLLYTNYYALYFSASSKNL